MATIIDSLIVTLGLDSSKFEESQKKSNKSIKSTGDEAEKTAGRLKKTNKQNADGFAMSAKSVLQFFAVLGASQSLKSFIEDSLKSMSALDRLSKNLGASTETIGAWGKSVEAAGGTVDGLQSTLSMLSKAQTDLQVTGESSLVPYLSALGVGLADVNGKAKSGDEVLLDLAKSFETLDRSTAFNLGKSMGIDEGTLNLLLEGRKSVQLAISKQKEYGLISKKQAEESTKLNKQIILLKQGFSAFGRELSSAALPVLEKVLILLNDFLTWCKQNQEFISTFLTVLTAGLVGIGIAVTPINLTAVALVALSAAIAALYQDYQVWKRGGDSFIDWSKWKIGIDLAKEGLNGLIDTIADVIDVAGLGAGALGKLFNKDFAGAQADAKAMFDKMAERASKNFGGIINGVIKIASPEERQKSQKEAQAQHETARQQNYGSVTGKDNKKATSSQKQVRDEIFQQARARGLSEKDISNLVSFAQIESNMGKNVASPLSTARGVFQFIESTGAQYGLNGKGFDNRLDYKKNIDAGIRLYLDNKKAIAPTLKKLGLSSDDTTANYLAHQQGAGGVSQIYKNLSTSATMENVFTGKNAVKKAKDNAMFGLTARESVAMWEAKLKKAGSMWAIPNASQHAQPAMASTVAQTKMLPPQVNNNVQTSIGEIKVYTQATDSKGIVSGIKNELASNFNLINSQFNTGQN